jgi:hypothetical protein
MAGWRAALRLAALRLSVAPKAFWRLSLAEWRALTESPGRARAGPRKPSHILIARFPDEEIP